jgi:hypothetical protein
MDINAIIQQMMGEAAGNKLQQPNLMEEAYGDTITQKQHAKFGPEDTQARIPEGAMLEELMQLIGPAGGGGQDIAAQVQQAVGVPIPPQVLQYMIEEGWTPEEMIEILAKEVQETGGIADNPIPQ